MNAMILAAGLGTRLGALGRAVPKVLIDVGGRSLLERHLAYLEREGFTRVVINAYHHAQRISSFAQSYDGPLDIVCLFEERLLGTAGAVRNALPYLEPGPFVVLYGDVLIDEPVEPLLTFHRRSGAVATLAVHESDSAEGKGVVEMDGNGRVRRFVEKGAARDGPVLINSGLYVLEAALIEAVPPGVEMDFGHDIFPDAVEHGEPIFGVRLSSTIIDIGTREGLVSARATIEQRERIGSADA